MERAKEVTDAKNLSADDTAAVGTGADQRNDIIELTEAELRQVAGGIVVNPTGPTW